MQIELREKSSPNKSKEVLRNTNLVYNKKASTLIGQTNPYKGCRINIEVVEIEELYPTAKYVLSKGLRQLESKHESILSKNGIDSFLLDKVYTCSNKESRFTISPIIVEEMEGGKGEFMGIVDGLHRAVCAMDIGYSKISAFVIHNPNIPLPFNRCSWSQVLRKDSLPPYGDRRDYNRDILEEVASSSEVTLYDSLVEYSKIFYRDLSFFSSKGTRTKHE